MKDVFKQAFGMTRHDLRPKVQGYSNLIRGSPGSAEKLERSKRYFTQRHILLLFSADLRQASVRGLIVDVRNSLECCWIISKKY